ncbi:hypothetical protein [Methanobrevibacter curvatus]|uniref:Uncharacterized protein n=1 Tax=Methanobrevibacter curvatus TaxID=49547 RepID=A0A162FAY7_9EURY|nr:hypothetical protein [Methanobrevibacter curvatus]KZX10425.1 hypothetical protein MBCUR_17960 [Methanobrevibacter curvatus]
MVSVEYDMEKEMEREEKNMSDILNSFSEVNGLEDILKQTLDLYESEFFNKYTKNVSIFADNIVNSNKYNFDSNFLKKNFHLVDNAMLLKKSKIKLFYFPNLWGDTIVFEHFESIFTFCFHILSMKKILKKLALKLDFI